MNDDQKRYEDRPAPKPRFPVRVVSEKGDIALIEWDTEGDHRRAYFPKGKIKQDGMTAEELGKAQPYGEDWAEVFPYPFGRALSIALHRAGVWTFDDLALNRPLVSRQLWAVMGIDALIRARRN